jgi:hypothetical protein
MYKRGNALSRPVLMVRGLDVYLYPLAWCSFQASLGPAAVSTIFGGHSEGETPLPIPNRAVKPLCADGTWCSRAWESRSPPVFSTPLRSRGGVSLSGPATAGGARARERPVKPGGTRDPVTSADRRSPASHRRRGGSSRVPPSPVADRPDGDRFARDMTRPREAARGRTRPAWRSRSLDRRRRALAGRSSFARGTLRAAR